MSKLTLDKRPLEVLQHSNHRSVLGSRGKLNTLKRKKLQILKAMSRLTNVLMDIEDVLAESELYEEADMCERKRLRLSHERGTDEQTVLATQVERCEKRQSTKNDVVSDIANHVTKNSRKRPRDHNDIFIDNNNDSYEIVIRNNFGGKREEILSCFDCRKLLEALLSNGTVQNEKYSNNNIDRKEHDPKNVESGRNQKVTSKDKRKPPSNSHRRDVSHVTSDTQQQQDTAVLTSKCNKENSAAKKQSNGVPKRKIDQQKKGQTDVQKQKSNEKKSSCSKSINIAIKNKTSKAAITKQEKPKNKENMPPSIISANNNVYKEIMNNKEIKKEPDNESMLSDRTKQLYEILAGN